MKPFHISLSLSLSLYIYIYIYTHTDKSYPFTKVSYNKYLKNKQKKNLASSIKVNTQNTNQVKQPISYINLNSPNDKCKVKFK